MTSVNKIKLLVALTALLITIPQKLWAEQRTDTIFFPKEIANYTNYHDATYLGERTGIQIVTETTGSPRKDTIAARLKRYLGISFTHSYNSNSSDNSFYSRAAGLSLSYYNKNNCTTYNCKFDITNENIYIGKNTKAVIYGQGSASNTTKFYAQVGTSVSAQNYAATTTPGYGVLWDLSSKITEGETTSLQLAGFNTGATCTRLRILFWHTLIPEILTGYQQTAPSALEIPTILTKNTASTTQTVVVKTADAFKKEDFNVTLTKKSGKGTFSTPTLSFDKATQQLTITFTYTSANNDDFAETLYTGILLVETKNTHNTATWTTTISGACGNVKKGNTLAWDLDNDIYVNSTDNSPLKNQNNIEEAITITSSDATIAKVQGGQIQFLKEGEVTLRAQQNGNDEYEAADISTTITVKKRTAVFADFENPLFTEETYEGFITVTNDPNNTLLSKLTYSGANDYLTINNSGNATVKTNRGSFTLHIAYAGDDEWNAVNQDVPLRVVLAPPAPAFCLSELDMTTYMSEGVFITNENQKGTLSYSGNAINVKNNSSSLYTTEVVIRVNGIPNKLTFNVSSKNMTIGESANGVSYSTVQSATSTMGDKSYTLLESTRYIKFTLNTEAGGTSTISNFCITGASTFIINNSSNQQTVYINTDGTTMTPASFTINHVDMRSISISSSDAEFVATPSTIGAAEGLGTDLSGDVPVEVTFTDTDYTKTAILTLTGTTSSGGTVTRTVNVRINATHPLHYATLTAYIIESGTGKVFVSNTSTEPADNDYVGTLAGKTLFQHCSGEMGADDALPFYLWAKPNDGFAFDGWYLDPEAEGLYSADPNITLPFTASSTNPNDPSSGVIFANFIEDIPTSAPVYTLNNLDLGTMTSGGEPLQGTLQLLPEGENSRPLFVLRDGTTISFTDVTGHTGEAQYFSAETYSSGSRSFSIHFNPTCATPATHTYQALATVTATNDEGTTIRTAIISATVNPAVLVTYTAPTSHTFSNLQRNQQETWNATLSDIQNAVSTPALTLSGAGSDQFTVGDWDEDTQSFAITFSPNTIGNYTVTATVSIENYDEVATTKTITLIAQCVQSPDASFDVQNEDGQSVVGTGMYYGDFNAGDATSTHRFTLTNIQNMQEASTGYVPTVEFTPAGIFTVSAYDAVTHSFNISFTAVEGMEMVQNAAATFTVLNNDGKATEKQVPLSAFVVKPVDYDVRVTKADGSLIENGETTWAKGLEIANEAANVGCTVTLMRNISGLTTYQTISNTFTLDLNGKRLSGNNKGSLIYINAAGKTLTIKDNKGSGRIENINNAYSGEAYCVNINAGSLILQSGTLYVENKDASGRKAIGINSKEGTTATVNGGKVEVYGYNDSYAIKQINNKNNLNQLTINNGELYVEGYQNIYGINANGKVNVNGGTIGAKATYYNPRGICMTATASTTAADCFYGVLTMTGGTINSECTSNADGDRIAYGVYFYYSNAAMGDATATDGSHANKASAIGTISNATINVSTEGRKGIRCLCIRQLQLKEQHIR